MITKKSEAIELLKRYEILFAPIINKPCTLTFDKHKIEHVNVLGIEIAKTTGMKNAPDKRQSEDGKNKSPMVFRVKTDQGDLIFTFDDTFISSLGNGIRLRVGESLDVDLRME